MEFSPSRHCVYVILTARSSRQSPFPEHEDETTWNSVTFALIARKGALKCAALRTSNR